jgi:hypothetical protein
MVALLNLLPILKGWKRDYNYQTISIAPGAVHRIPSPTAWAYKGWLRWLYVRVNQRYTNIEHNLYAEKAHVFNYYNAFLDGIWMAPPDGQLYLTAYNIVTDRYVAMMNNVPPLEFDKGALIQIIAPTRDPVTGATISTPVSATFGWYAILITNEEEFKLSLREAGLSVEGIRLIKLLGQKGVLPE